MKPRLLPLVVILSAFVIEVPSALGQQPAQPEKTVKFTADVISAGKPWRDVFKWLAETTGKPVITVYQPTGRFPCRDLLSKEYTIPQVVDIINEALQGDGQTQKYYLIQRERSFTLIPTDEHLDMRVPRIRLEDLKNHGKTELVSIVVPLTKYDADEVAPQIKKVMGPFGEAIPMKHVGINQLILSDTVGNLNAICKMLDEGRVIIPIAPPDLRRRTDPDFGGDLEFGMKWDVNASDITGRRQRRESATPAVGGNSPERAGDPRDPRTVGARSEAGSR